MARGSATAGTWDAKEGATRTGVERAAGTWDAKESAARTGAEEVARSRAQRPRGAWAVVVGVVNAVGPQVAWGSWVLLL